MGFDREQVERDLERFAALAPTLGTHAAFEMRADDMVGVDPAFAGLVATTIVGAEWWLDEAVGAPLFSSRRARIRRVARARKARRGWA